ncbi:MULTISPECIES: hypothetical protein [Streptomyces]|uniref:hypothetical protein n=1 Tax=Streptomyces TaxID=1883 RepID=UPI00163C8B28|nr:MULTISPECIES: hypothetical protein [Streptomyces]MBC2878208.1 hypothetical protein [Streptomyces sp. TYQ1024]UBI39704.1 hypothetical protein K7I03_26705 [Streptomyces mobaraensis]UKW32284.1 hypothetical protein MCU78_26640 [Streptomyces sp. TYQ1024]
MSLIASSRQASAWARWLCRAAKEPRTALAQWSAGCTTPLTIGTAWDLVQLDFTLATAAVTLLKERNRPVGPYLMGGMEHAMWWLLPLGAGNGFRNVPRVAPRPKGAELFAPPPGTYTGDRAWVLPEWTGEGHRIPTAPDDLRGAVDHAARLMAR